MTGLEITDQVDEPTDDEPRAPRLKPSLTAGRQRTPKSVWQRRAQRKAEAAANTPQDAALPEWYRLAPSRRDAEWAELVDWVIWLHDRYGLDVEERLPRCWVRHPGLIEELRALRAWRIEIYTSPDASGQAARYWHAELRQTINAANTFYASGCRAGHHGSTAPAHPDEELQKRWKDGDHSAGIPPAMLTTTEPEETTTSRPDSYLHLTDDTMTAHRDTGKAVPLNKTVTEFLRYDNTWWTAKGNGWLRIIDDTLNRRLDKRATDLARADQSLARLLARKTATEAGEDE